MSELQGDQAPKSQAFAIVSLVTGIVAFLFGWTALFGFIVGAAAVIFGILGLQRKRPKGLTVTGLVLGAIGAFTSLIATVVLFVGISLAGSAQPVVSQNDTTTDSSTPTPVPASPEAAEGSRENPLPFGTSISNSNWDIKLLAFNPDGNAAVLAANQFNPDPAPGKQYVVIELEAAYKGSGEGYSGQVQVDYVSGSGEIVSSWDSFVVGIEPVFGRANLYAGGVDKGSIVFEVPSPADGLIRVDSDFEEVFFSLP